MPCAGLVVVPLAVLKRRAWRVGGHAGDWLPAQPLGHADLPATRTSKPGGADTPADPVAGFRPSFVAFPGMLASG